MDPKFVQKMVTERSFDAMGALIQEGQIGTFDENRLTGKEPHIFAVGDTAPVFVEQSAIAPTGPNPTVPQQIPPDAVQGPGGAYVRPGVVLVAERTMDADQRLADRLKEGDTSEGDLRDELRRMDARTAEIRALLEQDRQNRETAHRAELSSVGLAPAPAPTMDQLMDNGGAPAGDSEEVTALKAEIERLKNLPAGAESGGGAGVDAGAGDGGVGSTSGNANDALVEGTVKTVTAELGTKTDDQLNAMLKAENDREQPRVGVTKAIQTELDTRAEAAKQA